MTISVARIVANKQINLLDQRGNYYDAKIIARENGGRLSALSEFIFTLKNEAQFEKFKGDWYWLCDEVGLGFSGYCKIDYDKGTIIKISQVEWNALLHEQRVYAYKGSGPFALGIYDNYEGLGVYAGGPDAVARVAYVSLQETSKVNSKQASPS